VLAFSFLTGVNILFSKLIVYNILALSPVCRWIMLPNIKVNGEATRIFEELGKIRKEVFVTLLKIF